MRVNSQLKTSHAPVDIAHYRSVLKNQAIVDEAEKILKNFTPVTYDVSEHVKAIEAFEVKAVCIIAGLLHGLRYSSVVCFHGSLLVP